MNNGIIEQQLLLHTPMTVKGKGLLYNIRKNYDDNQSKWVLLAVIGKYTNNSC